MNLFELFRFKSILGNRRGSFLSGLLGVAGLVLGLKSTKSQNQAVQAAADTSSAAAVKAAEIEAASEKEALDWMKQSQTEAENELIDSYLNDMALGKQDYLIGQNAKAQLMALTTGKDQKYISDFTMKAQNKGVSSSTIQEIAPTAATAKYSTDLQALEKTQGATGIAVYKDKGKDTYTAYAQDQEGKQLGSSITLSKENLGDRVGMIGEGTEGARGFSVGELSGLSTPTTTAIGEQTAYTGSKMPQADVTYGSVSAQDVSDQIYGSATYKRNMLEVQRQARGRLGTQIGSSAASKLFANQAADVGITEEQKMYDRLSQLAGYGSGVSTTSGQTGSQLASSTQQGGSQVAGTITSGATTRANQSINAANTAASYLAQKQSPWTAYSVAIEDYMQYGKKSGNTAGNI